MSKKYGSKLMDYCCCCCFFLLCAFQLKMENRLNHSHARILNEFHQLIGTHTCMYRFYYSRGTAKQIMILLYN